MAIIFAFSAMPGSPDSFEPTFSFILERKGAHVVEYFGLTLLAYRFLELLYARESFRRLLLAASAFALAYGALDELHQFFTPYRGAKLTDVGVDLIGILLAAALLVFFRRIRQK